MPLSPGNVFHVGNDDDGKSLEYDLMQGFTYGKLGFRRTFSDLDLAILADCGIGTIRSDILNGSPLYDSTAAGAGNDIIRASVGNDLIDGGSGLDSVSFQLARSQVRLSVSNRNQKIVSSSDFGSDTLISIERIDFTDGDLIFDVTSARAPAAYRLYGGAFDRTPDEGGFRYWMQTLDSGVSLHNVAASFIVSKEFTDRYGSNQPNAAFVDALYLNVLNRPGEAAGVAYWNDVLNKKLADQADVLVSFTQLPEYVGLSLKDIENGY